MKNTYSFSWQFYSIMNIYENELCAKNGRSSIWIRIILSAPETESYCETDTCKSSLIYIHIHKLLRRPTNRPLSHRINVVKIYFFLLHFIRWECISDGVCDMRRRKNFSFHFRHFFGAGRERDLDVMTYFNSIYLTWCKSLTMQIARQITMIKQNWCILKLFVLLLTNLKSSLSTVFALLAELWRWFNAKMSDMGKKALNKYFS